MKKIELKPDLLNKIVNQIKTDQTQAVILVGSYARGDAKEDSDIDITHYVKEPSKQYSYQVIDGYKMSIFTTTIDHHRKQLSIPESAIWVVPYLRIANILFDPNKAFASLHEEAINFKWEKIQGQANIYANNKLEKFTEEVVKIITGLKENDDYPILESLRWIVSGLAMVVAVQKGIYLDNESTYLKHIQNYVGYDSNWSQLLRQSAGLEPNPSGSLSIKSRGIVALNFYVETVKYLKQIITPNVDKVINHATELVNEVLKYHI